MLKVLHYKSNFLNYSETFIKRLIDNHKQFKPVAMGINKRGLSSNCPTYIAPENGWKALKNTMCFHLNLTLPFYKKTLFEIKPDIIHAHFGFDGYRMIKPSKKLGIPLIVSFYGSDVTRLPSEFDWKRRYRKLSDHADQFIAVSNLMKEKLIKLGFQGKRIHVIRFGLDLDKFLFDTSKHSDLPLMMVGRMVEKKGFIYGLKAIKTLNKQEKGVHLDLYGDGKLRNKLETKANQWGISHLIHFKNRRSIEEIRRAYQTHRALLIPSVAASDGDQEGIPNTLLEGMASGIPVIATNHSAIPEVISHKDNGLMIPEKDPEALAEMIRVVIENKVNLSRLRENARKKIAEEYELHRMVEEIERVYRKARNNIRGEKKR